MDSELLMWGRRSCGSRRTRTISFAKRNHPDPDLASYGTAAFIEHFLHKAMGHLLTQLDKPSERHFAFIAIGHTATAIKGDMKPFLDDIMEHVKQGLQARGYAWDPIACFRFGIHINNLQKEEHSLELGRTHLPMHRHASQSCGSEPDETPTRERQAVTELDVRVRVERALVSALGDIVTSIPPLLPMIQGASAMYVLMDSFFLIRIYQLWQYKTVDRLLDMLCMVLSGKPYRPLGAPPLPPPLPPLLGAAVVMPTLMGLLQGSRRDSGMCACAFTFVVWTRNSSWIIVRFVLEWACIERPCTNLCTPLPGERQPQCQRGCRDDMLPTLREDPICYQASNRAIETLSDVLDKLLTVGIADPDANIRHVVLSNLHERFDKQLAQAGNIRSLFVALNDEEFKNRVTAVGLIGRLARHNPAYVMPSLRKALIQLLTELEYSTLIAAYNVYIFLSPLYPTGVAGRVHPTPDLVSQCDTKTDQAVCHLNVRTLLPKAKDSNATVASNVLTCLGELVCIAAEDASPCVPT
ncbi:phosphatidylinositol kinase- protein kinase [Salix suchowensis]|nr:phosphatidylinositol kinase- protein kinase [Salix suchowensis]